MRYDDLRGWIDEARALGQLRDIAGAHLDDDIGRITEMFHHTDDAPAGLFDDIPGFPSGHRILVNASGTRQRLALTLGLDPKTERRELMNQFLELTETGRAVAPLVVDPSSSPLFENTFHGDEIDVTTLPAPIWHEKDGGRYIGTGVGVVMRDPDEGWVNMGTYRVMVHDERRVGVYISPGKHGKQFLAKYHERGEPCPIAIVLGPDPLAIIAATVDVPYGVSEYDWIGGIRGEAYPVVEAPITGLPVPANAEVVLEGFLHEDHVLPEGPFGEWHGYYASGQHDEPFLEIEGMYHRTDPILVGMPPNKPPWEPMRYREYLRSALLIGNLQQAGLVGIVDAQCFAVGGNRLFNAVSIEQRYPGHARSVLHVAAMGQVGAYMGRITIVVDEDIDVTDISEVIWAVVTRVEPEHDVEIVRRGWSGPLDTPVDPEKKNGMSSRLLIDATRPWEWRERFPEPIGPDPATKRTTREEWGHLLK